MSPSNKKQYVGQQLKLQEKIIFKKKKGERSD